MSTVDESAHDFAEDCIRAGMSLVGMIQLAETWYVEVCRERLKEAERLVAERRKL